MSEQPRNIAPDRPSTKAVRHGFAIIGVVVFLFAAFCAASIKGSASHGSVDAGLWMIFLAVLAAACALFIAAGSDNLQPSIDAVADKSLDTAAATLRGARLTGEQINAKVKATIAEIERRSK